MNSIGSSLAIALAGSGLCRRTTALDNLRRRGSELNLRRLRAAGVAFVHGDIRCPEDLAGLDPAPDLILECSAEPSAQAGYNRSPEYLVNTNLLGCFHCLELARRVRADFVLLSTSRVYPYELLNTLSFVEADTRFSLTPEQTLPGASGFGVSERFPLEGPRSLYGMTKLAAELMVQEYADAYGLRSIINRCGLVTGPWQMGKTDQGVLALWMAAHFFGHELSYIGFNGSGKQVRDFLHIDDLCALLIEQIRNFDVCSGSVLNVGGGVDHSLSLRECTDLCQEITGNHVRITAVAENRPADLRIYISDHRQASRLTGWRPCRDARSTLSDIFRWIRDEETLLRPVLLAQMN